MLIQIKLWYHLYIKLHACAVLLVETPDMIFLILLHLKNPRDRFGGETNRRGYQNMKMDQRTGTVAWCCLLESCFMQTDLNCKIQHFVKKVFLFAPILFLFNTLES